MMRNDFTPEVSAYVDALFAPEDAALAKIRQTAESAGLPAISIGPQEGRLLQVVAAAVGARRALEIGTLAGYSGLWIARALDVGGHLVTIEMDADRAALARDLFAAAGMADRVTVLEGSALEVLPTLTVEPPFDLVFIDADKESYPQYLDWALKLTHPGAAILAHNVFLDGEIVRDDDTARIKAMRAFNERLATDPRLESTLVPVRDGMSVAIVRG